MASGHGSLRKKGERKRGKKIKLNAEEKGKERRFILSLAIKAARDANPFTLLHKLWTVH
jgi:hypothetical protein